MNAEQYAARVLKERDESRANGDAFARVVASFLKGKKTREDLEAALAQYRDRENFFVVGHVQAIKELAPSERNK